MNNNVEKHVQRFYELMSLLESSPGQGVRLSQLPGIRDLPARGIYFFRESGEFWSGGTARIVRVGTHAVSAGSKSTLHSRLKAHRGSKSGTGNHRGSIFRLHVGHALLEKENFAIQTWGVGSTAPPELRANPMAQEAESMWEKKVSEHIGAMTVLWVDIPDEPSATSMRAFIERNAIALLSNHCSPIAPASKTWLGLHSPREAIRTSFLWNLKHVDEGYDPAFLDVLERAINRTRAVEDAD